MSSDLMIERTELGVLISYEDWDELQEKLENGTASEELNQLKEENKNLKQEIEAHKNALRQMNSFLNTVDAVEAK